MDPIKPSTLVTGSNIISRYLRYFLVPFGLAYKFDPNPPHLPQPLSALVVLSSFSPALFLPVIVQVVRFMLQSLDTEFEGFSAIMDSVFIWRLAKIFRIYRILLIISCMAIVFAQHGCISNIIASGNNYLTERDQTRCARVTFMVFCFNAISNTLTYSTVFVCMANEEASKSAVFYSVLAIISCFLFWIRLTFCTPLIFCCYLSSSLGKHVENFSTIYVDSMFNQFMKQIEKEGEENKHFNQVLPFSLFEDSSSNSKDDDTGTGQGTRASKGIFACAIPRAVWRLFTGMAAFVLDLIRKTVVWLSMRRYPELPEMKMTKLSSTTNIQISERTRRANNYLLRVRLRRTQVMLSILRDSVNDINRTSSPLVLLYLIYETVFLILVTTVSVQGKVYKSFNALILPTILVVISLASVIVHIGVCYDETTKQLRLLINKLFDFIITNHRVQSSGRQSDQLKPGIEFEPSKMSLLPGSEMGAINETWSQFQYIRKLAGTIQFTLGGVVPITRRLILSILGHILSVAFLSIEIMSIVDTMQKRDYGDDHQSPMRLNSTESNPI